jgi:hypothetical protein
MNTPIKSILFNSIEPLLKVCLAQAERHGLSEIRISTARVRELHREIVIARKALEKPAKKDPAYFAHLDNYCRSLR